MRLTTVYKNNQVYLLANDTEAENFAKKILDKFMVGRNENCIFIFYHVKDEIILIHLMTLDDEISFDSAIQLVKEDILNGKLRSDDKNLQKALNDPHATTAKFLLDYIATEE